MVHPSSLSRISTPCINVCVIDAGRGLCAGCGRTLDEIGRWLSFSEAERQSIMTTLAGRLAVAAPEDERV